MANEISVTVKLDVSKGFLVQTMNPFLQQITMIGDNGAGGIQAIGFAAHEAISIGDTGTAGWAYFRNTSTLYSVEIGVLVGVTFYPFAKLLAGEGGLIRLGTNAPYAKAATANVNLQYLILSA